MHRVGSSQRMHTRQLTGADRDGLGQFYCASRGPEVLPNSLGLALSRRIDAVETTGGG